MIILSFDVGSKSLKCNLLEFDGHSIEVIAESVIGYELDFMGNGFVEQDTEAWWSAICNSTKEVLSRTGISPESVAGISMSAQMMGITLIDKEGVPIRPSISYLDSRGREERQRLLGKGIKIVGCNAIKLIRGLWGTGVIPLQDKDVVWKYKWVEHNEPEAFSRLYKWLDVKDYLNGRMTGNFVATHDSAFVTMLYNPKKREFNKKVCRMFEVNPDHLPDLIESTDVVGTLTEQAASEMGLVPGIPVFGGGGDVNCAAIGSGAADVGEGHIYCGTSGWSSITIDHTTTDLIRRVCSIVGSDKTTYNYLSQMETAGGCFEWAIDNVIIDSIGVSDHVERRAGDVMDIVGNKLANTKPGANGVIFAPWINGERCPVDDSNVSSIYFNIHMDTTKMDLMRAICEGICYNIRWMIENQSAKIKIPERMRFVGGCAKNPTICQVLSDITGLEIDVPEFPRNSGSIGAAIIALVGLGQISELRHASRYVNVTRRYVPTKPTPDVYDKTYGVFRLLYKHNKKLFHKMNRRVIE